ncbi:MAG: hypothetical protein GY869_11565, partial [Planctomycetes bacterium]|nr:hypothetical protein [Planctomycetota bacterium]
MKQILAYIGAWLILAIGANHQSMAQEIKITDYDVPVSQSQKLWFSGELDLSEEHRPDWYYRSTWTTLAATYEYYY